MKLRALSLTAALLASIVAAPLQARDTKTLLPLDSALNSADAKAKLKPEIQLYFGTQAPANIAQNFGEVSTSRKTNAFNKSDSDACNWAFLSAMIALQERALKDGGNAVINIKSNYKNHEVVSDTQFECGAGAFAAGVTFKGTVVKLK